MLNHDTQKRQEATRALINIAIFEGILFAVVVAVYFYTGNIKYMIGGFVLVTLISGPMFIRWFRDHGAAMKDKAE